VVDRVRAVDVDRGVAARRAGRDVPDRARRATRRDRSSSRCRPPSAPRA
jgi:hypothetical protein